MLSHLIRNRAACYLIIVLVGIFGLWQFLSLPVALYPPTSKPVLRVWVNHPGMGAEEFRFNYGNSMESAMQSVKGLENIEGEYLFGRVSYSVEFEWGRKPEEAKSDIEATLSGISQRFPKHWSPVRVWYNTGGDGRVTIALSSDKIAAVDLERFLVDNVKPALAKVKGTERAWVWTIDEKFIAIEFISEKLLRTQVSPEEAVTLVQAMATDRSLGQVSLLSGQTYEVQVELAPTTLDSFSNLPIKTYKDGSTLFLRDIADISFKQKEVDEISKGQGKRKVLIGANPKPDANLKDFAEQSLEIIKSLTKQLDPNIHMEVFLNPATFINSAIRNILFALLAGVVVATAVVFIFLGNLGSTIVVSISIPLSLVAGFILMNLVGIQLNLISLGAMALSVGMVVDGSIVVLENIYRWIDLRGSDKALTPDEQTNLVVAATREVSVPIFVSLLTTIIVFVPLPFTNELASAILGDLAKVVVCVLCLSIAVSLVIVPVLANASLSVMGHQASEKKTKIAIFCDGIIQGSLNFYLSFLEGLLNSAKRQKYLWLATIGGLLVAVALTVYSTKWEIMPPPETDKIILNMKFVEDITIEEAEKIADSYEKQILEKYSGEVAFTFVEVNKSSAMVFANMKSGTSSERLKAEFEESFPETPEMRIHVFAWSPSALSIPQPPVVELFVNSTDNTEALVRLDLIRDSLSDLPEVGRKSSDPSTHKNDFLNLEPRDQWLSKLSSEGRMTDVTHILDQVSLSLAAQTLFESTIEGRSYEVQTRLKSSNGYRDEIADIEAFPTLLASGQIVALKSLFNISIKRRYPGIFVANGRLAYRLKIWPKESYSGRRSTLQNKIMTHLKEIPGGLQGLTFSDTDAEINENLMSLAQAFAIAVGLVFLLIVLQFAEIKWSLVVMLAIPFGIIGVGIGLWIFGASLNVNSMLGMVLLAGSTVNNSILFLDFYMRRRKDEGLPPKEALLETAKFRFRPIMMTSLTTILGMIPLAVGLGNGGEILQALGISVAAGLTLSTPLCLVLIPSAIMAIEKRSQRVVY